MATYAKLVFPPPPPTTNELTSEQRQHLLRRTKKLEQILGTTPHFVDTEIDIFDCDSPKPSQGRRNLVKTRRSSLDSTSSLSSDSSTSSPVRRSSSTSSNPPIESAGSKSTCYSNQKATDNCLAGNSSAPMLHLRTDSLSFEEHSSLRLRSTEASLRAPIPYQSPSPDNASISHCQRSARSSISPPTFQIESSTTIRKRKMDRVRKKLGHDVPYRLVFPEQNDSDLSDYSPPSSPLTPAPPSHDIHSISALGWRSIKASNLTLESWKVFSNNTKRGDKRHAPGTKLAQSNPSEAPPLPAPYHADRKRIKARLSLILEIPDDEQLSKGSDSDEGSSSYGKASEWLITFERLLSSEEPSSPESSPTSTLSPVNLTKSIKKKRPASYRKPVPPMLEGSF